MKSRSRVLAIVTLGLLALALLSPTHELGDTAAYGRAYLWGESSSRVNMGREIVWFVDRWEVAQHALFAMAAIACMATIVSGRHLALVALGLTSLIGLALQRSSSGDGVTMPLFMLIVTWTLAVWIASMVARRSPGGTTVAPG